MPLPWLPPPEPGTAVCGGFDGSEVDDLTVIKLETFDGYLFTPRYGPDDRPTIWRPEDWGGRIPRHQVSIAWEQIADRYRLQRVYCDPFQWQTDIERWDTEFGPDVFAEFPTNKVSRIFPALTRFTTDLEQGRIRHDGCPTTTLHVNNAQRLAQRGDTYALGKPTQHQKIDAAVTSVIAHQAASDARAAGWQADPPKRSRVIHFTH